MATHLAAASVMLNLAKCEFRKCYQLGEGVSGTGSGVNMLVLNKRGVQTCCLVYSTIKKREKKHLNSNILKCICGLVLHQVFTEHSLCPWAICCIFNVVVMLLSFPPNKSSDKTYMMDGPAHLMHCSPNPNVSRTYHTKIWKINHQQDESQLSFEGLVEPIMGFRYNWAPVWLLSGWGWSQIFMQCSSGMLLIPRSDLCNLSD